MLTTAGVAPAGPGTDRLLSVTTASSRAGRVVVEAVGEVDAYTTPLLEICLQSRAGERGLRVLVVDLSRVTFLGASGMSVLARAADRVARRGARLVVVSGGRRAVRRPLELAGLADLVGLDLDLVALSRSASAAGPAARGRRRRPRPRPRTRSSRRPPGP